MPEKSDCHVKYWEIIADRLSKAGWSWGRVSAIDSRGRMIWIAEAHRDDGQRFIVHADDRLTAFVELESATRALYRATGRSRLIGSRKRDDVLFGVACNPTRQE
jgi:hypothetical protein